MVNLRSVLCAIFGHQPREYSYRSRGGTTTYTECGRCRKRKKLNGVGWMSEGDE